MKVIGLTGGYGTGKTTVARMFRTYGARIIDLDKLAHACLRPSHPCFRKIIKAFGRDIVSGKSIHRKRLAQKVFGKPRAVARLNRIIHPYVIKQMVYAICAKQGAGMRLVVVEAPLLFEARLQRYFDYIVVVTTSRATQVRRLLRKTKESKVVIAKRIRSQLQLTKKAKQADFIIDNNGSLRMTSRVVKKIIKHIKNQEGGKKTVCLL